MLREIVSENHLTADDILHKIKKTINEPPMNFQLFKESIHKIDSSLS